MLVPHPATLHALHQTPLLSHASLLQSILLLLRAGCCSLIGLCIGFCLTLTLTGPCIIFCPTLALATFSIGLSPAPTTCQAVSKITSLPAKLGLIRCLTLDFRISAQHEI